MSPRRKLRRRDAVTASDDEWARGVEALRAASVPPASVQAWAGRDWMVRTIPGGASDKSYRCPGCDHEVRPGVSHVVAWPVDGRGDGDGDGRGGRGSGAGDGRGSDGRGAAADRRHWHTGCWRARDRRTPSVQRSRSAPRYG